MKSLIPALALAAVLAAPAVSFAQSNAPASSSSGAAQTQSAAASGYGGVADATSASGSHHPIHSVAREFHRIGHDISASIRPDPNDGMKPTYFGA